MTVLPFCERYLDATIETIEMLARLESPSTDKPAVDRCGSELTRMLADAGADVRRVPQRERGDHLVARLAGSGEPVMLLGHFDTVWPIGTLARMPVRRDGDRLFGPGTFDMKAGIALALTAIAALRETRTPHAPVVIVLSTDEEIGSATSRTLIEEEARRCRAVFVLEPALPGGALKTARKGCGEFELIVHGIAAHAGLDPGKGASAIHELAAQIAAIERLQDLPRGISVNVGVIGGGTRPNVVAEEARALIDARAPTREDAAAVESSLRTLQPVRTGTRLTIRGGFDRPPMERTAASRALFARARDVAASLGHELAEGGAGGARTRRRAVAAVAFGPDRGPAGPRPRHEGINYWYA
jgi:glutamate carboxypeptidase